MALWFTADTHFGHANIIRYSGRPFHDVNHMDEALIEAWNRRVLPEDTVYHLGDLALGRIEDSLAKTARLNGRRVLVPGNHDRVSAAESLARRVRFAPLYEAAGWVILPESVIIDLDGPVMLSHYPYRGDQAQHDRHAQLRPEDAGLPLLHGHIHELRHIDGRMFNVGVDVNDYAPVHEDVIREWLRRVA